MRNNMDIDMNFINPETFDKTPGMERIKYKKKLIKDVLNVFSEISSKHQSCPKAVARVMKKSVIKDLKKGLKVLNSKIPVYIELPKYEKVGNGQVKLVSSDSLTKDDEVAVTTPTVLETSVIPHQNEVE